MHCIILPSAYLAPIDHYAHLAQADEALLEACDHYAKQTLRNRCEIAGPGGVQSLTIPVVKPERGKQQMRDIRISDHGNWRHLHWNALKSAYNRTPFFEYYADDFAPFYEQRYEFLYDFNMQLQTLVCSLLDIDTPTHLTDRYEAQPEMMDLRPLVEPHAQSEQFTPRPYYQVFAHKHGFLPNLSIVDLLFNMGPEGLLWLVE